MSLICQQDLSLSNNIFSPKISLLQLLLSFFLWKRSSKSSNSSTLFGYLNPTFTLKQLLIFAYLSLDKVIFDSQNTSFISPNILFLTRFWANVVFPQPVLPTARMFPSSFASKQYFISLSILPLTLYLLCSF